MEMKFQNLQLSDENLQSYLYPLRAHEAPLPVEYPLREGEAPLPIEFMCKDDVPLLAKFITTYRDQITLPTTEFCEPDVECYDKLAFLLRMLKALPVLGIIEIMDRDSTVIDLVRWLKARNFGGSWLDSLERVIVDNLEKKADTELKLRAQTTSLESSLREVDRFLRRFNGDLSSEESQDLSHLDESLGLELADVMEKRKALSVAREALMFFYPV